MTADEKRKVQRFQLLQLLDYLVIDEQGDTGDYSMGRTLDISVNGIRMETPHGIAPHDTILVTLGLDDELVDLSARPIHSHQSDSRFIFGMEFIRMSDQSRRSLVRYLDAFQWRKEHNTLQQNFTPLQAKTI